jgi:hypothetical protein
MEYTPSDDGIFWMSFDDFKKYFTDVSIGKVNAYYKFSDVRVDLASCCHSIIDFKVESGG